jgi:hypothetical protein
MKALIVVTLAVCLLLVAGVAYAQDYAIWATQGQISPDRVLAERARLSLIPNEAYAPYTPTARYAFDQVFGQVPPERALASRNAAGAEYLVDYLPYTAQAKYAPGCVCTQISPDRVLAERVACGMCSY